MKCPFCNFEESKVADSRESMDGQAIKRRRQCLKCNQRFTTFETIDLTVQVLKRDETYEDFKQEKLFGGIMAACRHTRVSHDKVKSLAYHITADLTARQLREITTRELGAIVMKHLQEIDTVAYIRFACVYKRFKDIKEILDAIDSIKHKDGSYCLTGKNNFNSEDADYASTRE
ncbi:MAG: Transcriptional repressor NrdR [Candidatus Anoxychlamydiales bacterium]|nr:Transcriptional repressor NrdR [Candidatus Anoxychlamydiales bacterium]